MQSELLDSGLNCPAGRDVPLKVLCRVNIRGQFIVCSPTLLCFFENGNTHFHKLSEIDPRGTCTVSGRLLGAALLQGKAPSAPEELRSTCRPGQEGKRD